MASLGGGSAWAQSEAASVKLGNGINFTPTLSVDLAQDDNVTLSETDKVESLVAKVRPNFLLTAEDGVSAYSVSYALAKGEYFDSKDDNYLDHFLDGDAFWELNFRHRLALHGSYTNGHDARGSGFSLGRGDLLDEPDRYHSSDFGAVYSYGAESAKGQIDIELGTADLDYAGGVRTRERDRGTGYGGITFNYNAGGKTKVLAEITRREVTYDYTAMDAESLDSAEMNYRAGVTWEGTAQTTGRVKVGLRTKDFDSSTRDDFSGAGWEAGVRWVPLTYSAFDFSTARRSRESWGDGDFIDVQNYAVTWHHSWAERFSTQLTFDHELNDYRGVETDREETVNSSQLRMSYQMQRWLSFSAGVSLSDQDSTREGFDYEKNLTFIGIQASL
ncbi:outer membrane beta-barrel protein [Microbulbifer pacificus]|uniref:Outer membrane beta-barrel protein n=1 Tax=Microbulbifer pacificus TaxID=407164 RepID=A0AAU0MXB7_9GAMM|nr:outer membrane beta-barrel protein [Microbulbifer pacificus]WOX04846.1 outer membrane beta-barrel protein [Microbulbifer pacificus]